MKDPKAALEKVPSSFALLAIAPKPLSDLHDVPGPTVIVADLTESALRSDSMIVITPDALIELAKGPSGLFDVVAPPFAMLSVSILE